MFMGNYSVNSHLKNYLRITHTHRHTHTWHAHTHTHTHTPADTVVFHTHTHTDRHSCVPHTHTHIHKRDKAEVIKSALSSAFYCDILTRTCWRWQGHTDKDLTIRTNDKHTDKNKPTRSHNKNIQTRPDPHSEHHFLAASSKLWQNWLHHWRVTLYFRTAVHRWSAPSKRSGY